MAICYLCRQVHANLRRTELKKNFLKYDKHNENCYFLFNFYLRATCSCSGKLFEQVFVQKVVAYQVTYQ